MISILGQTEREAIEIVLPDARLQLWPTSRRIQDSRNSKSDVHGEFTAQTFPPRTVIIGGCGQLSEGFRKETIPHLLLNRSRSSRMTCSPSSNCISPLSIAV